MGKRIGSKSYLWLFLFLFVGFSKADVKITLSAIDKESARQTETVSAGVPFILNISIFGDNDVKGAPNVSSIEQFLLQQFGSSMNITTINGVTNRKRNFRYLLRINQPGNYSLGPVSVEVDGKQYKSDVLCINVDLASLAKNKADKEKNKDIEFQISIDKSNVFVGQQIVFEAKVYNVKSDISLKGIGQPQFDNFTFTPLQGPIRKNEKVD